MADDAGEVASVEDDAGHVMHEGGVDGSSPRDSAVLDAAADVARGSDAAALAPDAAVSADGGRKDSGAEAISASFDGFSYADWLLARCYEIASRSLGPFNRATSITGKTCPQQPPFTSLQSAIAAGCVIDIVPNSPEDLSRDGFSQSVLIHEGGLFCNGTANFDCGGARFRYVHSSSGVDAHETQVSSKDCLYRVDGSEARALTPTASHVPALAAFCHLDTIDAPIALIRDASADNAAACPLAPPFSTPEEARMRGCRPVTDALALPSSDADKDHVHLAAGFTESVGSCTITASFECAGTAWTWQRSLSKLGARVTLVRGTLPPAQTSESCRYQTAN